MSPAPRHSAPRVATTLARSALMTGTVIAAAYAGTVALAAIRGWVHGTTPSLDQLLLPPWDVDTAIYLAVVLAVLAVEAMVHGWHAHPLRRSIVENEGSHRTDLFYLVGYFAGVIKLLIVVMTLGLSELVDAGLAMIPWRVAAEWPLWVAVPVAFVLADFMQYWVHRLMHTPLMWPLHAVHHAARDMTTFTAIRHHPLDMFLGGVGASLPLVLLGFSAQAVTIATILMALQGTIAHSSLPCPLWLQYVLVGPDSHRIHHADDPALFNTNFSRLALWDHLFGTFALMDARGLSTGVADPDCDTGRPMRDLRVATTAWLAGLCASLPRRPNTRLALVRIGAAIAMLAAGITLAQADTRLTVTEVAAEGTQFRVSLSDGRVLRSPELVGARLSIATPAGPITIRIEQVERDPDARTNDVWLHTLLVEQPDGSSFHLCAPGPDGRRQAFPLASRMRADGRTENTPVEQFDLLCSAGARAKCVRFGYRPWVADTAPLYDACTRMVRADYCGEGEGTTLTGMSIDMFDDRGIQVADNLPDQTFEAGWTADGAVCVNHVRVKENTSLSRLAQSCPRLAERVGPACTPELARSAGAVLFNRSRP